MSHIEVPDQAELADRPPRSRRIVAVIGAVVVLAVVAFLAITALWPRGDEPARTPEAASPPLPSIAPSPFATPTPSASAEPAPPPPPPSLSDEEIQALPVAIYDAVIPGLLGYTETDVSGFAQAYTAQADVPVFGEDFTQPVARLPASNFLDEPTVIVPVRSEGDWTLVLTPSRQQLPSSVDGDAPAQTAGWVPTDAIDPAHELTAQITISVSQETLTVTNGDDESVFDVGVGTEGTPTPTGTTGYLQARYDDPSQADYTIQLTTLHSSAADEPFGGSDGGLIGMHYNRTNTGAVSHGCIRLAYDALMAVNDLPLGTPVVIVA